MTGLENDNNNIENSFGQMPFFNVSINESSCGDGAVPRNIIVRQHGQYGTSRSK